MSVRIVLGDLSVLLGKLLWAGQGTYTRFQPEERGKGQGASPFLKPPMLGSHVMVLSGNRRGSCIETGEHQGPPWCPFFATDWC